MSQSAGGRSGCTAAGDRTATPTDPGHPGGADDTPDALHPALVGYRIRSDPPPLVPLRELHEHERAKGLEKVLWAGFEQYGASLDDAHRHLLARFSPVEVAFKVVGLGSVGTRCLTLLLLGPGPADPLFLQFKEATASVLEESLGPSAYAHHGQRVVEGQRLMQAVSDTLLGWARIGDRDYYWRQLRYGEASADIDRASVTELARYARPCG